MVVFEREEDTTRFARPFSFFYSVTFQLEIDVQAM